MNEKKRKILLAAMKLFSKKSFHQTSMQEIASICGQSKGSLYTHFNSKEELLFEIFVYYFQLLEDKLVMARQRRFKSDNEQFIHEVAIQMEHYYEFQEFYIMQMKEIRRLDDSALNLYIRKQNGKQLQHIEQNIIMIYGEAARRYASDLACSLTGMMVAYMKWMKEKQLSVPFIELSRYLIRQLNGIFTVLKDSDASPIFKESLFFKAGQQETRESIHPLVYVNKIRIQLTNSQSLGEARGVALESIALLEKELMEISPKAAIVKGMLANLKEIACVKPLVAELERTIRQNKR
ncbi:TetR/AcrR family transcriptional regulator [Bacillus xiapuensis]|uniref:TetR/AcrR family transcriptional regulator n=1 Tax=Bacillus xiapuensis TaxID=2014075 RepID=UPI000C2444CA|nr:TetR/AcrR family transcriptional regulator [Bacillus xiapuensis]